MKKDASTYGWYALKIFFNKVFAIEEMMALKGVETYIPAVKVEVKGEEYLRLRAAMQRDGATAPDDRRYLFEDPRIFRRVPLVRSLMFLRCQGKDIKKLRYDIGDRGFVYLKSDGKTPAVIPDREMAIFRLVADSEETGLTFYQGDPMTRFKEGVRVRVKEGPLKGAEGYIKRIKRDRRLLVAIEGVVAVATAFIPPENLEPVPETPEETSF